MPLHRREFLAAAAGAMVWAWLGCARKNSARASRQIRLATGPYLNMSGLYLARELGYFVEAGLDVEFQQVTNAAQAIPLLAGGKLDVAFFPASPSFINAVAKDARLRIVAGREIASPTCGNTGCIYGTRKAFPQGLGDLKQLRGKRIAFGPRGAVGEFFLDLLLVSAGMTSKDVQGQTLSRSEAVAVLAAGKIDAMLVYQSDKDLDAVAPQLVRSAPLSHTFPNLQWSYVIYGEKLVAGDPAVGADLLAVYLRGAREFLQGKTPRFLENYARSNGLDPKQVREACRNTFTPDGAIHLEDLQRFVDWAVQKGYCPQALKAAQLVDTRFLEEVRRRSDRHGEATAAWRK